MNEKKTAKWRGWIVATGALALMGVLAISGAPRAELRPPNTADAKASISASVNSQGVVARAETDTLDLQLD